MSGLDLGRRLQVSGFVMRIDLITWPDLIIWLDLLLDLVMSLDLRSWGGGVRLLPLRLGGLHLDKIKSVNTVLSIYRYIYINIAVIVFTKAPLNCYCLVWPTIVWPVWDMLYVVRIHTAPWSRKSGRRPPCGIILTITALDIYLTICRQGSYLPPYETGLYRKGAHLVNTGAMTRCSKDLQQDRQQLSSSSSCSSILSTSTWWLFWGFEGAPTRWGWERDSGSCWKSTLPKIVYPKMCHK